MTTNLATFSKDERALILAAIYSGTGSDHTPVQNETALALIADMTDKMVCLVEDTGLYRYDATSTETAAVGNVVTPSSGVGRWIRISSTSDLRIHVPVADETALAAIAAGERSDRMLCLSEATGIYRFDATSAAAASAGDVVVPGAGTGRWLRVTGITDLKVHAGVADEAGLAAITAGSRADRMLCVAEATGLYRFDADSAAAAVAGEIVAPGAGTGRWFRITDLTDSFEKAFKDTAIWDLYVGGVNAAATGVGTQMRPTATVAQALLLAKAIQATTPTQMVRINIAADVATEAIVVADTDFTLLSFVGPEGRVTMTSFASIADNENLTQLHVEDINFSGDVNCTCDVSGATSLFCSGGGTMQNVAIGGNTTFATLGTMDLHNVVGVGTLTVRNTEDVRLHAFSVFGGAFLHDANDVGNLPAILAAGGVSRVLIFNSVVNCPTLTESGGGTVTALVTLGSGAVASTGSVAVAALCELECLEGSELVSGGADAVVATGILSLLGGQVTALEGWTINAAAVVYTRAYPGLTLYVDGVRGNDLFNGSPEYPFATVQAAVAAAIAIQTAATGTLVNVHVAPGTYAEAVALNGNLEQLSLAGMTPGTVTIQSIGCTTNAVLDRLDLKDLKFTNSSAFVIQTTADPFLATGLFADGCVWDSALDVTGATIAQFTDCYAEQFYSAECGNVICPSIGTVWRADMDEQAAKPLGVTASAVVLEEGGALTPPVMTHADTTGIGASTIQVTLRGGVVAGTGAAGRDCVLVAAVANAAILVVEEGSRILGSTDLTGSDNNIGANCVLEILPGASISNIQGWTVGGTVNDRRRFASAEQTGTGAPQNVAHGLGRIPEKVTIAFTELPAPQVFQSGENVGTGASQDIAHGLTGTPNFVTWGVSEDAGAFDLVPGVHDGTNLKFTANGAATKFYAQAMVIPTAPDVAEGAHDATNVVVTVTAGVKFTVLTE